MGSTLHQVYRFDRLMVYSKLVQFFDLGTCKYLHNCKNTKIMVTLAFVWQIFSNFATNLQQKGYEHSKNQG